MSSSTIGIYLNDHLGLIAGEIELIRRVTRENEDSPLAVFLSAYVDEVRAHQDTVESILTSLDEQPSSLKQAAGWLAEKIGRFKPNDSLTGYTDLARVLEIEALVSAAQSRLLMWETLAENGSVASADAVTGKAQTSQQLENLRKYHGQAVGRAFTDAAASQPG